MPTIEEQFSQHAAEDARQFGELRKQLDRIEKKLDPLVDVYEGVIVSKKLIVGLSTVVIAIGAIGAGVIWVINHAITK